MAAVEDSPRRSEERQVPALATVARSCHLEELIRAVDDTSFGIEASATHRRYQGLWHLGNAAPEGDGVVVADTCVLQRVSEPLDLIDRLASHDGKIVRRRFLFDLYLVAYSPPPGAGDTHRLSASRAASGFLQPAKDGPEGVEAVS